MAASPSTSDDDRGKSSNRPLSLVITTLNNALTIERCIRSVPFADEVMVLDSFSRDDTVILCQELGARVEQTRFRGYGPQKADAISRARYDRILLLDADESLSRELAEEISHLLATVDPLPPCRLLREEWLYWLWPRRGTGLTDHLRLFDRREIRMGKHATHAAPETDLPTRTLRGRLRHYGHDQLAGQLRRIESYTRLPDSETAVEDGRLTYFKLLASPPAAFLREYLLRRQFLNGWAGFIAARVAAFHAFLRHARKLEARRRPHNQD